MMGPSLDRAKGRAGSVDGRVWVYATERADRLRFDGSKGGFRAWIGWMSPGSWCCEVKDGADRTRLVWFEPDERGAREVLALAGARLGCEFRELAGRA